ncbi:MAG: YhdP family protein [Congregibacter sp.]
MSGNSTEVTAPGSGLHALAPVAWRVLLCAVVLLAVYLAAGRYLMSQMPALREPLLAQINERLPFTVEVSRLTGRWSAFSPELQFAGLRLVQRDPSLPPIALGSGSVRVDVTASLASGTLQLSRLRIDGLELDAQLSEDGTIEIAGFSGAGDGGFRDWLEDFLPNVESVELANNQMRLTLDAREIDFALDLVLAREGSARRLEGRVDSRELSLLLNAEGVGNPLRPLSWSGDIYVDARSEDLSAFAGVLDTLDWPFRLAGEARAEFWLSRAKGDSTARMRWNSQGLELEEREGAWSLPIDALSFEAALDQRSRHWSLITEDFHIERAGQALDLHRAQFDWWGQSLRIRAVDLSLSALPTLLAAAPGLPEGLRRALPDLAPQGRLSSIELRMDDLARPADSWQLRSMIEDLSIDSWRNAPALAGVSGYLNLEPGQGSLQLDAQSASMHFPSVYREPLRYDEALGDVRLNWDSDGLRVHSGLMSLENADGIAHGLFAVDVPFSERVTGVELELLIGLQDSRVEASAQYLPFKLPKSLLGWLDRSAAAGELASAGFVWRGSVRQNNQSHMTVQLFLDARDVSLSYDPAWPALHNAEAEVWVDDGRAWARVDRAESEGAVLTDLMVSVMPEPGAARLAIASHVDSDASTAELLLRDSPLHALTNGLFADWTLTGELSGDVGLQLKLGSDPEPPQVDLALELQDLGAHIAQLGLSSSRGQGLLRFKSGEGFSGSSAKLEMLGGSMSLTAADAIPEGLSLAIEGEAASDAIALWLQLPMLNFASGSTQVLGELQVSATEGSRLSLRSDLLGITLDAPRPYGKMAEQPLPLSIDLPLRAAPEIRLALGDRLRLHLGLQDGELQQLVAAVGGGMPDISACDQRYCLSGTISSVDIAQWASFYQRYIEDRDTDPDSTSSQSEVLASSPGGGTAVSTAGAMTEPSESVFTYRIDSLKVGELKLSTRSFGRSRVDLWGRGQLWQGALESNSVQGSLTRRNDELHLLLERLDLDRFAGGEPTVLSDLRGLLPDMRIDVLELTRGSDLVGSLGFNLDMSQGDQSLYASDINGELLGLRIDESQGGLLRWSGAPGAETTELELDLLFDDIGGVLSAAGYEPTLESEFGRAALRLQWPGAPSAFAMTASSGSLGMSARNGRVLESRPGALAMVSFLNLAEVLRGLSLAYMFDAGIPFITADAQVFLHRGMLEIAALHIDGAASRFAFNGLSDLARGSIDGELLVTLPVANNLPWVAALAAGLPVAAGVFVVSKVFQKQVNRMSSAVYGVSGDIQAPEVEFRRLFDDELTPIPPAAASENETGAG